MFRETALQALGVAVIGQQNIGMVLRSPLCVLLLLGENDSPLQEADQGLVKTAAGFLGKQMEN